MAGRGVVIQITGDGESAKRALEMVQEHLRETAEEGERSGHRIAESMEMVKRALEFAAIDFGIREAVDALKEAVKGTAEYGEQMVKASQRTGLAVETLSTLHYAAAVTGSDFDGLVGGLSKMNKGIGEAADGNKKAQGFVKGLGLDAKDLAGRTDGAEIAFHKFVQTLAATESPIRRNELAMGLLGKAGSQQIPMLIEVAQHWDEFKQKAEDAGVALTGETAAGLAEANRKLHEMSERVHGAEISLAEGLTPAITEMLGVISGGKSQMDAMKDFGMVLGKVMAFAGAAGYGLASALETVFAGIELVTSAVPGADVSGALGAQAQRDLQAAKALGEKADAMRDIAMGKAPAEAAKGEHEVGVPGDGFEGTGGDGKGKKEKSDDPIARAAAELATEQAKAAADAAKYLTQAELADLDAKHKLLITSDAEYYARKMQLQTEALDAEQKALESKQTSLGTLLDAQKKNPKLNRKDGVSAEELRTQRELVQVQDQLNALKAKGQELESANTAQVAEAGWATELAGLKLAADLEKERNDGISAQIALIERETELRAQKVVGANGSGADEAAVRALGEQEKNKLRIGEVNRQITDTENDYKRAIEEVNDAAAKDPRLKRQAEKETSQLNQEEAESLRGLVVQYDALAQVLGGEYIEKAKQLHAELDKLSRPDQRDSAAFAKTLAEGVEGMTKRVVDATQQGRESFRQMVRGMEKDVLDLALKLAEQKWLTPMLEGGGGQLPKARIGGAAAAGQAGAGAAGIVNQVPQLYQPQASSSSALTSLLPKLLGKGAQPTASSSGFKVIIKLDNSTGQTLTARQTGQSFDGDSKEYIVNAILENVGQGGPLASLFSSMSTG